MKVPKFLTFLAAFLVVVVFVRATNDSGPLSLTEVVLVFEDFDYDFKYLDDTFNLLRDNPFTKISTYWDTTEDGITGFFRNIQNVWFAIQDFLNSFITSTVEITWNLSVDVLSLVVDIFRVVGLLFGF